MRERQWCEERQEPIGKSANQQAAHHTAKGIADRQFNGPKRCHQDIDDVFLDFREDERGRRVHEGADTSGCVPLFLFSTDFLFQSDLQLQEIELFMGSHRKKRAFFPMSVPSGGLLSFKLRCSILLFFTRACPPRRVSHTADGVL